MPRKPTLHSRRAREELIALSKAHPADKPIPALGVLGGRLDVHAATVFRILRDLVAEGYFWQSPTGRFFTAAARRGQIKGAPLCFIGREVWQWSRLYQEVLEGVSEVCAANQSPLVVLTARTLLRQASPAEPPQFAGSRTQSRELSRLLPMVPKGCAGVILDHLWAEPVLRRASWPGGQRLQLFRNGIDGCPGVSPDLAGAASMVSGYIRRNGFRRVLLVVPFRGDPALDAAVGVFRKSLSAFQATELFYPESAKSLPKLQKALFHADLVLCPEDNVALALAELAGKNTRFLGTQGTGVLHTPHARLRYDFRRLGRSAAAHIIQGTPLPDFHPLLIERSGIS